MISQESIQQVYAAATIEDVVSYYVELRKRGANLLGLCPFHDEKTPSFTVSPAKNIYKCFGCGKGGDPVRFIMEHDTLSYPEAIRWLAARYNIELEESREDNDAYLEQKQEKESLQVINDYAKDYFVNNLWETQDGKAIALSYFKERGFREATIKKFDLGYATVTPDDFTKQAVTKQYNIELLRTLGLTSKRDYDFFRDRVMFTIHNVNGKPIAFAGRTLITGNKKIPKYINSPETPIYNKSSVLYAMHLAKSTITKQNNCYLVEGYTDVISLHQGGIENVVASSGTSLTPGQIKLIKRYADTITLLYDGDAAGIKAALRGLDLILAQGLNVFLVTLPESHDPDSYLQEVGKTEFEAYIENTREDFIEYQAMAIERDFQKDPIGKARAVNDVIKSLSIISDSLKRTFYIQRCAEILNMREIVIQREVSKAIKTKITQSKTRKRFLSNNRSTGGNDPGPTAADEASWITEQTQSSAQVIGQPSQTDGYQERDLARICLAAGDKKVEVDNEMVTIAAYIYSSIFDVINYFDEPVYRDLIIDIFNQVENGEFSQETYTRHDNELIRNLTIDSITDKYFYATWPTPMHSQKIPIENFEKDSLQAILRFKYKKIKKIIGELKERITALAEAGDEDKLTIALLALKQLSEEKRLLGDQLGTTYG